MSEEDDPKDYFQAMFGKDYHKNKLIDEKFDQERVKAALKLAHEIRQFEIRLYWHRSLFFWGFILTLFASLGLTLKADDQTALIKLASIGIAALGFFTTCAWYFIEKGSKAWQHNWELHIDYLEDSITGQLYKTMLRLGKKDDFFSVSKITRTVIIAFGVSWFLASFFVTLNATSTGKLECFFNFIIKPFETHPWLSIALPSLIFILARVLACRKRKKVCFFGHWRTSLETIPEEGSDPAKLHEEDSDPTKLHLVSRPLPKE